MIAACTRESKCTTSRIHQQTEKNTVPLKEVLTHPPANARRTLISNTTIHPRSDASSAQKYDADDCQFARSDCAAGVFITRTFGDRRATNVIRPVESGRRRVAWTLSLGFWQEKNFSSPPALRLFVLAKTGLSGESPPPIRKRGLSHREMHRDFYGERPVHDARA